MDGNALLRLLAESAAAGPEPAGMPPEAVRFSLEYASPPDLAAERPRVEAAVGTAAFSLRPYEPADGALARFLVLQFPSVGNRLSRTALFEIGNVLADALGLVSCEPDAAAPVFPEPDPLGRPTVGAEASVSDLWCWSNAAVPADRLWALKAIRAPQAWAISPAKGKGVLVGQPDTGVAAHPELETGALALDKAKNVLEGGTDPTDPLRPTMSNPGHGTATASVVVSREAGVMAGAAPAARVAPIRCVDDVKIFNGAPVAEAVAHARKVGCDVVTMSLGGTPHAALGAAIADAVAADMIVLAAAGNCVNVVVYPARDPNVIAVAGVDVDDKPWTGTSWGPAVAVAAPGENVYVARRKPGDGGAAEVSGGQGTSFAVALTAGVAALWIAHHGRAAIRQAAAKRGVRVQEFFRWALRQSVRKPSGWRIAYGDGVVNAEKLLKLELDEIVAPPPDVIAPTTESALDEIARLADDRRTVDGFDWARHGAEAGLLAIEAAMVSRRAAVGFESLGGGALRPSTALAATAPAVLRGLFGETEPRKPTRALATAIARNERLIRIAGKESGGGAESAATLSVETAVKRLKGQHSKALLEKASTALGRLPKGEPGAEAERARVLASAESGLKKLAERGVAARLTAHERVAMEAIVNIHDRPALRVRDAAIDPDDPLLGDWTGALIANPDLSAMLKAVGRVDLDGGHVGTGWVLAPGLIMTNRHVLEAIAEEFRTTNGETKWAFVGTPSVNFDDDGRGTNDRFAIRSVAAAGPDRIDGAVDFAHLDMAVLEVETQNAAGRTLPAPLPLVQDASIAAKGAELLIAGYPARPGVNALRDPATGEVRDDVVARLRKIFGVAYSVKYLSPGEIDEAPGALSGDPRGWAFAHDATTLGGNSGSWALHLGEPFGVVGLHFGGGALRANYAHSLAHVRAANVLAEAGLAGAAWI